MISRIKSIVEGAKQKILTDVGHPIGSAGVVISQIVQVEALRIASRGEEEMNVIIALLVVTSTIVLFTIRIEIKFMYVCMHVCMYVRTYVHT